MNLLRIFLWIIFGIAPIIIWFLSILIATGIMGKNWQEEHRWAMLFFLFLLFGLVVVLRIFAIPLFGTLFYIWNCFTRKRFPPVPRTVSAPTQPREGRTYRLHSLGEAIWIGLLFGVGGGVFTVVPILHWASMLKVNGTYGFDWGDIVSLLFGLLSLHVTWHFLVREPYEISLLDDGTVLFKKALYCVRIKAHDITAIRRATRWTYWAMGEVGAGLDRHAIRIEHMRGYIHLPRLSLLGSASGSYYLSNEPNDLFAALRRLNPSIKVDEALSWNYDIKITPWKEEVWSWVVIRFPVGMTIAAGQRVTSGMAFTKEGAEREAEVALRRVMAAEAGREVRDDT